MALPTYAEQTSLEFIVMGLPYVGVSSNNTVITDGIHFIVMGMPHNATISTNGPAASSYNATLFFTLF